MTNSRRTFLKTVGLAVGSAGMATTAIGETSSEDSTSSQMRTNANGWTHHRYGPSKTGYKPSGPTTTGFETAWTRTWDTESVGTWDTKSVAVMSSVVADGTVYISLYIYYEAKPTDGVLYAVDAETGDVRWSVETNHSGELMVIGDTVYHTSHPYGERLVAFDSDDGSVRWSLDTHPGTIQTIGDESGLYVLEEQTVTALTHDGEERWSSTIEKGELEGMALKDGTLVVTTNKPAEHGGRTAWSETLAFDTENGNSKWTWRTDRKLEGGITLAHGHAYVTVDPILTGLVVALDLETGTKQWETDFEGTGIGDPGAHVAAPDTLYIVGEQFQKVDPETGDVEATWVSGLDDPRTNASAAGDTIYFAAEIEDSEDEERPVFYAIDRHDGSVRATEQVEGAADVNYDQLDVSGGRAYTVVERQGTDGWTRGLQLYALDLTESDDDSATDQPTADIEVSENCDGTYTLDGSGSTDPDGEITDYYWDIKDDGDIDESGATTEIDTSDYCESFCVRLKVQDDSGCTAETRVHYDGSDWSDGDSDSGGA